MVNDNHVNSLIDELRGLQLERTESLYRLRRIQRRLEEGRQREEDLINRIQAATTVARNHQAPAHNALTVGDRVRITNALRDEYDTVGVVIRVGPRLVTIRGERDQREYTRGWWNLELTPPPARNNENNAQ